MSLQMNVWCMNLETGDKYHAKKWRSFYNIEKKEPHNIPIMVNL